MKEVEKFYLRESIHHLRGPLCLLQLHQKAARHDLGDAYQASV